MMEAIPQGETTDPIGYFHIAKMAPPFRRGPQGSTLVLLNSARELAPLGVPRVEELEL